MTDAQGWVDISQKIGSGAAFVMMVGFIFLWRAYTSELAYSKTRDLQTLTVMMNLSKIVETIDLRDKESVAKHEQATQQILAAIQVVKDLVSQHYAQGLGHNTKDLADAAATAMAVLKAAEQTATDRIAAAAAAAAHSPRRRNE